MTDIISQLADQLVALNNASPRLPTKQQIEEVLLGALECGTMTDGDGRASPVYIPTPVVAGMFANFPGMLSARSYETAGNGELCPSIETVLENAAMETTAAQIARELGPLSPEEFECHKRFQERQKALKDAMNSSVYGGPTVEDRERFFYNLFNPPPKASPQEQRDNAAKVEAQRATTGPCPGSTDGSHAWSYDMRMDETRCPCGAVEARMTPTEQDILRASLEKTCDAFFRRRSAKRTKLVLANGHSSAPEIDATGLLVVLSGWVGDLIKGAPDDMRDNLFLAFADTAAEVAGIKDDEPEMQPELETLQ